jgi:hypothetical protein
MRRPLHAILLLVVALLSGAVASAAPQRYPSPPSPAFEFHSGFWVNLNHFLYIQGRLRQPGGAPASSSNPQDASYEKPAALDGLTANQQKDWNAAVDAYAKRWSTFDLLDNNLELIDNRLAELENCPDLSGKGPSQCISGLQPPMIAALTAAAPIYRARWWPQQDRDNRAWIDGVAPLVRQMGEEIGNELTQVYLTPWPQGVLRVDVVGYAGAQGAYTTRLPFHPIISSADSRNQNLSAFEVLFREASAALADGLNEAISAQCRRLDIPIPRDLWQAMLYYTTGELVRRALANDPTFGPTFTLGQTYVPYAYRNGLFAHGWSHYQAPLERYWQPYLDGQLGFDAAISRIISAL